MGRVGWAGIIGVVIIAIAIVYVNLQINETPDRNPLQERELAKRRLERHAEVFRRYRAANDGRWPADLPALRKFSRGLPDDLHLGFASNAVPVGIIYRYRAPPVDVADAADDLVIMAASKPHPPIPAAQQSPGPNGSPPQDLPPVYYLLTGALQVESCDAATHKLRCGWTQRQAAGNGGGQ